MIANSIIKAWASRLTPTILDLYAAPAPPPPAKNKAESATGKSRMLPNLMKATLAFIAFCNIYIGGVVLWNVEAKYQEMWRPKLPETCEGTYADWRIEAYGQSIFQMAIGTGLVVLLTLTLHFRIEFAKYWTGIGIILLLACTFGFFYSHLNGCNPIELQYLGMWLIIHLTEILCVGYYMKYCKLAHLRIKMANLIRKQKRMAKIIALAQADAIAKANADTMAAAKAEQMALRAKMIQKILDNPNTELGKTKYQSSV